MKLRKYCRARVPPRPVIDRLFTHANDETRADNAELHACPQEFSKTPTKSSHLRTILLTDQIVCPAVDQGRNSPIDSARDRRTS